MREHLDGLNIDQYIGNLGVPSFPNRFDHLTHVLTTLKVGGLHLEFGVWTGKSLRHIAETVPPQQIVYGFESFEGLPTDWVGPNGDVFVPFTKGFFAVDTEDVKKQQWPANVQIVQGTIEDTLPKFFADRSGAKVAFCYIDTDIYSSCKTILTEIYPYLKVGTVIVFDELYNYPAYQVNEYQAFLEWLNEYEILDVDITSKPDSGTPIGSCEQIGITVTAC